MLAVTKKKLASTAHYNACLFTASISRIRRAYDRHNCNKTLIDAASRIGINPDNAVVLKPVGFCFIFISTKVAPIH